LAGAEVKDGPEIHAEAGMTHKEGWRRSGWLRAQTTCIMTGSGGTGPGGS